MAWELVIMADQNSQTRNARPELPNQKSSAKKAQPKMLAQKSSARSEVMVAVDSRVPRPPQRQEITTERLEQIKSDAKRVASLLGFDLRDDDLLECVTVPDPDSSSDGLETVIHTSLRYGPGLVQHRVHRQRWLTLSEASKRALGDDSQRAMELVNLVTDDVKVRNLIRRLEEAIRSGDTDAITWWCDRIERLIR